MKVSLSAFSRWALDAARSREERFLVFLLCEECRRQEFMQMSEAKKRANPLKQASYYFHQQLQLNPLMEAPLTEWDTEQAGRWAPTMKKFGFNSNPQWRRIGEAGAVLRFFPALEELKLGGCDMADISFLEVMPNLKVLGLSSALLSDLGPLRNCTGLEELSLGFTGSMHPCFAPPMTWLDGSPLGVLTNLRSLTLYPNAGILRGLSFPKLETAKLTGSTTVHPDCTHLPDMPALRYLELDGVQSLAGIARFTELRHLKVSGGLRDWGDLPKLKELDCLEVGTLYGWPRDVTPLAELEALRWVKFEGDMPRNYWPLTGAPRLCELEVKKPMLREQVESVAMEVAAVNAVLHPWDGMFGLEVPRTPPPLRFVALGRGPGGPVLPCSAQEPVPDYLAHPKMFHLELVWMWKKAQAVLEKFDALVGEKARSCFNQLPSDTHFTRSLSLSVETLAGLNKLPQLLEALRGVMACSAKEWRFPIWVDLRFTPQEMTKEQRGWLEQIESKSRDWDDEQEYEIAMKKQTHLIETEFRLRMNEEEGEDPEPEDFIPPEEIRPVDYIASMQNGDALDDEDDEEEDDDEDDDYALKPFDEQELDDDNDDDDEGDENVKVARSRGPDRDFMEDPYSHPLADSYRFMADLTWDTFYVQEYNAVTAMQCMNRPFDEDLRGDA